MTGQIKVIDYSKVKTKLKMVLPIYLGQKKNLLKLEKYFSQLLFFSGFYFKVSKFLYKGRTVSIKVYPKVK